MISVYFVFLIFVALPPGAQRALEQMTQDLSGLAPGFTIRRTLKHAQEEMQQIEDLRMVSLLLQN